MMREIVLDTETTGLNPADGHRILEIGALEMINHVPTGRTFHVFINPEREIEADAAAIHGITNERVANEPLFTEIVDGFMDFIGDDPLVIHNAPFDMGFINAELEKCGRPTLPMDRAIDTLVMARRKFPGGQVSLDALCRKFGIDNSHRNLHGAMVDTDLLADVYIELLGGKQPGLSLTTNEQTSTALTTQTDVPQEKKKHHPARVFTPTEDELKAHQEFIDGFENPLWKNLNTPNN
jgi:DNA polymerase-3 subunit epsilon